MRSVACKYWDLQRRGKLVNSFGIAGRNRAFAVIALDAQRRQMFGSSSVAEKFRCFHLLLRGQKIRPMRVSTLERLIHGHGNEWLVRLFFNERKFLARRQSNGSGK